MKQDRLPKMENFAAMVTVAKVRAGLLRGWRHGGDEDCIYYYCSFLLFMSMSQSIGGICGDCLKGKVSDGRKIVQSRH